MTAHMPECCPQDISAITSAARAGADASSEGVQRDLLPIIEGSVVTTKHGNVNTDHILFICSGAFHSCKPSDMLAELQGRLPVRVELKGLTCAVTCPDPYPDASPKATPARISPLVARSIAVLQHYVPSILSCRMVTHDPKCICAPPEQHMSWH